MTQLLTELSIKDPRTGSKRKYHVDIEDPDTLTPAYDFVMSRPAPDGAIAKAKAILGDRRRLFESDVGDEISSILSCSREQLSQILGLASRLELMIAMDSCERAKEKMNDQPRNSLSVPSLGPVHADNSNPVPGPTPLPKPNPRKAD